jgi:UDP-N-acetylmuramoylalanine--D-glutamate ligase
MTLAAPPCQLDTADSLGALGMDRKSRVLIVGLGKTGYSVARFLGRHGIQFAVADNRSQPPMLEALNASLPGSAVFLGRFESAALEVATHLIVSPGVALDEPAIMVAKARRVQVLGDLDLFACMAAAPIVAITGSNGKSTVTTLVGLMAEADGKKAAVGGNLGTPMLDLLEDQAEIYVLELSSFQLERSSFLQPAVATVLNISPDHMDRYPDLESYAAAKARVFGGAAIRVLNRDDPLVVAMADPRHRCTWFGSRAEPDGYGVGVIDGEEWLVAAGEPLLRSSELRIQGRHNILNALAAVALGDAIGFSRPAILAALRRFGGLDHRMQRVAERNGVTFVNDSKATNVGACAAALAGLKGKAVLIAGGDGKGADFSVLRPEVGQKVRALVLMGKDADKLRAALEDLVPTRTVGSMRDAVLAARDLAQPGDTVLLAPACASLDQYADYQERGRKFAEAVRSILQ